MKAAQKSAKAKAKKGAKRATGVAARKRAGAPGPTPGGGAYLGQIQVFGFPFAPVGWSACNGQLLPIAQNQPLFSLLGTIYGGNGVTTFGLPKLNPVAPQGPGYFIAIQGSYPPR